MASKRGTAKKEEPWLHKDIPDLNGKIFIVTGANQGLGYFASLHLVDHDARVILACRSEEKARTAIDSMKKELKKEDLKLEFMPLDLGDMDSVRKFASDFKEKHDQLHGLLLNAGIMMVDKGKTKDGWERQIGTNHLTHFALTGLLLGVLENTEGSRVVTHSSLAHKLRGKKIFFDDFMQDKSYDPFTAYSQSKLANLLMTKEMDRRCKEKNVRIMSLSCHPGWSLTNLAHGVEKWWLRYAFVVSGFVGKLFMSQSPDMGCLPLLRAATDPNAKSGEYYGPSKMNESKGPPVLAAVLPYVDEPENGKKLWDLSEELTGVRYLD